MAPARREVLWQQGSVLDAQTAQSLLAAQSRTLPRGLHAALTRRSCDVTHAP